MFSFPVEDYQRQLVIATLDDFTPNAALSKYRGGQYGVEPDVWRQAVIDFICVNTSCGLIEATHRPELGQRCEKNALRDLLIQGDINNQIPVDVLWNILYFNGTVKLITLIESLHMRTWDAIAFDRNPRLIAELEKLYAIHVR